MRLAASFVLSLTLAACTEAEAERAPVVPVSAEAPPEPAAPEPAAPVPEPVAPETEPEAPTEAPIPPENQRSRADDPPPRPPGGDVEQARASRLFDAIVRDDPALAADFFFPREAFRHVKGIASPDAYWARLFARYERDIHALHASLPDLPRAAFDRLEIVRRGGWVRPGEEANRLPYWVARHNRLHYQVDGRPRTLEVRVLITWGERWYITHLSEFH